MESRHLDLYGGEGEESSNLFGGGAYYREPAHEVVFPDGRRAEDVAGADRGGSGTGFERSQCHLNQLVCFRAPDPATEGASNPQ